MFGEVILQNLLPSCINRKIIRCYAMKAYFSTIGINKGTNCASLFSVISHINIYCSFFFYQVCSCFLNIQYTTVIYKCIKFEFPKEFILKRAIVYLFIVIHILKVKFPHHHFTSLAISLLLSPINSINITPPPLPLSSLFIQIPRYNEMFL